MARFPFGRPVLPCPPSADGRRPVFVLGAYPSALHVRWTPPAPFRPIAALGVDNEPTPFWDGADQAARVERWARDVGWNPAWGAVAAVGSLNGPSGAWVSSRVLAPLGVTRGDAWITDCLDTYRASTGAAARLEDTYRPFAATVGLPPDALGPHPSESDIVTEALRDHRARLVAEIGTARPELVVTLGNAALRVLAGLGEVVGEPAPGKLAVAGYGRRLTLRVAGLDVEWLPLAHPAAPSVYQEAHAAWAAGL